MGGEAEPRLVQAGPQDVDAIRALVRAAYSRWIPLIGREPRPMVADCDAAVRDHRIDLLIADGQLLGLIETKVHDDHLWIENVAVAPEAQGQGHDRRLLAHAERLATGLGRTELRLLTNAAFESNVRLYHSVGYETARSEPFMGGTTLHLSKRLAE